MTRSTPRRINLLAWIGPPLAFTGAITYFTVFARYPALRDFPWLNLPWTLAGVVLSVVGLRRALVSGARRAGKIGASLGLGLSVALATLFGVYLFVISAGLPAATSTARTIAVAPDFVLPDQHGRPLRLADLRGRRVVLTFFRGHW